MKDKYYRLYYTIIKRRYEKEIVNNNYEDKEVESIIFDDFVIPNHYIRRKNSNDFLK